MRRPGSDRDRARSRAALTRERTVRELAAALLLAAALAPRGARAEAARDTSGDPGVARHEPVAGGAPRTDRAEPLVLRVTYEAPPSCPSGSEFLGALSQHLAVGGAGPVDADVAITRVSADGDFELRLRQRVAGRESESVTRASSCQALMQLAALNASMARTPEPGASAPPREPPPPAAMLPAPAAVPSPRGIGVDAGELSAEDSRGPSSAAPSAFLLAEVRAASGMLPALAWGRGAGAGVADGPWSLRASFTAWQAQDGSFSVDGGSPIEMRFTQHSLELAPCAGRALSRLIRVGGCALLAGYRTGTDAQRPQLSGSIGAAALAALTPWRGLRVELEGGLQMAIRAPEFDADALRSIYRANPMQPTARIAVGWEFGGGRPPLEPVASGPTLVRRSSPPPSAKPGGGA